MSVKCTNLISQKTRILPQPVFAGFGRTPLRQKTILVTMMLFCRTVNVLLFERRMSDILLSMSTGEITEDLKSARLVPVMERMLSWMSVTTDRSKFSIQSRNYLRGSSTNS